MFEICILFCILLLVLIVVFLLKIFFQKLLIWLIKGIFFLLYLRNSSKTVSFLDKQISRVHSTLILVAIAIPIGLYLFFSFFDIDHAAERISRKSEYIQLVKMQDNFINIEFSNKKLEVFKLQLRDNHILFEQPFERMKYYRNNFDFKNIDSKTLSEICEKFHSLNMDYPFSFFKENIIDKNKGVSDSSKTILAVFEVIAHLKMRVDKVYIFVKGYSDTTPNEAWRKALNPEYNYTSIIYYKSSDNFNTSYCINKKNKAMYALQSKSNIKPFYSNKDLPFLRSMFVLDNYILNYLKDCNKVEFGYGILEGEIIEKNNKEMRNVEVYIAIKPYWISQILD